MAEARRIAILGGTFDPVHEGHLALATAAGEALAADRTWLLPASTPALRARPRASPQLRLLMLRAAVAGQQALSVCDVELRRGGVSYTVDTVEELARLHPEMETWWIVGADAARRVREWHRADDLMRVLRAAIVQRAGAPPLRAAEAWSLGFDESRTAVLDIVPPPISASDVRRRAAAGESIDGLVPPAVARIIATTRMYAEPLSPPDAASIIHDG